MEILAMVLQGISLGLLALVVPITAWQVIIGLRGIFPMKKKPRLEEKNYRFAAIVSARNEELVIGNLIDSLMQQDYPKDCYRVVVVADNCTDATAQVAREHGAIVYERFDRKLVGKGYALQWVFERLREDYPGQFDAAAIFDADNLVAPDFLTKMNVALCSGSDVVQGYRDTKNITDSSVSACYAIYWMMLTRFYHRARNNWGMSCVVSGTGFAFKLSLLEGGWHTRSLVEDCEFSIQQICAGRHIQLVYDAVIYDEQPVTWGVSIRQRFRWVAGSIQCLKLEGARCLRTIRKGKERLGALDMLMYMLSMVAMALMTVSTLCSLAAFVVAPAPVNSVMFKWQMVQLLGPWVLTFVTMAVFALIVVLAEHKPLKPYWKGIVMYPVFIIPIAWLCFAALLHPKTEWKPIVHNRNKSITDMAKPG